MDEIEFFSIVFEEVLQAVFICDISFSVFGILVSLSLVCRKDKRSDILSP